MSQQVPALKTRRRPKLFSPRPPASSILRFASAVALLGTLSGCQGIVSSPILPQLRIIDASPDAPGLDIYQGTAALAYNLGFGTITSYVPLSPGIYTISTKSAGSTQVLTSAKGTVVASAQYTVLIGTSRPASRRRSSRTRARPLPPDRSRCASSIRPRVLAGWMSTSCPPDKHSRQLRRS